MFERARDESVTVSLVRRAADRLKVAASGSRVFGRLPGQRMGGGPTHGETDKPSKDEGSVQSRGRFATVVESSMIGQRLTSHKRRERESRLTAATDRAQVTRLSTSLRRYVTGSVAYRWLTSEPEPDVIVIDLRETRTVGPILSVLDRAVTTAVASLPTSSVGSVGQDVATRIRARPVRVVSLLVLPVIVLSSLIVAISGTLTPTLALGHLLFAVIGLIGTRSRQSLEELLETRTVQVVCAAFEPPDPPERTTGLDQRSKTHADDSGDSSTESATSSESSGRTG